MSLTKPHPIWTSCGSNPYECHKAVITARMLSGRYPTDRLQRHWTENREGICLLPACASAKSPGTLEHLLLFCPSLTHTRQRLLNLATRVSSEHPAIALLLHSAINNQEPSFLIQLLLDCTTMPSVIRATQDHGIVVQDRLLFLGRTWCYSVHRERMNQLGLLKFR